MGKKEMLLSVFCVAGKHTTSVNGLGQYINTLPYAVEITVHADLADKKRTEEMAALEAKLLARSDSL